MVPLKAIDCASLCNFVPRELNRLWGSSQNVQHKMATDTISSNVELVQAGQTLKNIVLCHTAVHQCVLLLKIDFYAYIAFIYSFIYFCPTERSLYKLQHCEAFKENEPSWGWAFLFNSSWTSWFESSGGLRFTFQNPHHHQPSSEFPPPRDGFRENGVHNAFASKVHAWGWAFFSSLDPFLFSWEGISWAGQRRDQVHHCDRRRLWNRSGSEAKRGKTKTWAGGAFL